LLDRRWNVFIVLCIAVVFLSHCHRESEQDKVKKVITSAQKAVEERDVKKVMENISPTYRDPQGNTYNDIKGLVFAYFYQYPKVSIYIPSLEVSVEDTSAKALFQTILTGRSANEPASAVLPGSLDMYAFDVSLKKESSEWKIVSAKWERVGDAGR
jgi:hypothetical protein